MSHDSKPWISFQCEHGTFDDAESFERHLILVHGEVRFR